VYIRCRKCDKILAQRIGNNCIEIRNGKHHALIEITRANITCDRCGTRNIVRPLTDEKTLQNEGGGNLKEGGERVTI
jgi:ribosomal protein S27E